MIEWYPVIVNLLVGGFMALTGFKIHVPKFKSDEAKDRFYRKWSTFFKVAGSIMFLWGFYKLTTILTR
jgi:hypothetical protein